MKWRSIGLKVVFLAPVNPNGGMNEAALTMVGKTLKGSAGFTGDEPQVNNFFSNESRAPEESVVDQYPMQALKYGLMDLEPEKVVVVNGGEVVDMPGGTKKYKAPRGMNEIEHCARVITDFNIVIDFPRLKTTSVVDWPLDRQNIATVKVTHSALEPYGVNDSPYEYYQASELTAGQAGYELVNEA